MISLPDDCLLAVVEGFLTVDTQDRYFTLVYLSEQFYRVTNRIRLDWSALGCLLHGIQRWRRVVPNREDDARWKALAGASFRQKSIRREMGLMKGRRLLKKRKEEDDVNRLRLRLRKHLLFFR